MVEMGKIIREKMHLLLHRSFSCTCRLLIVIVLIVALATLPQFVSPQRISFIPLPDFVTYSSGWNTYAIFNPRNGDGIKHPTAPDRDTASGCGYIGTYTVGLAPYPSGYGLISKTLGDEFGTGKCFDYCYYHYFAWALCAGNATSGYFCQCGTLLPPPP